MQNPSGAVTGPRLFQVGTPGTTHPYLLNDMLSKVYNNLMTRSNTFGVWLTVGFFQVIDDSTLPVKLGPEIGASTATNIQHKFFCLVDRTQIVLAPRLTTSTTAVTPGQAQITVTQKTGPNDPFNGLNGFITYSGSNSGQISWQIQPGSILVVDRGTPQEETVVVTGVDTTNNRFQATFLRPHGQKFGITMPGNPGPQPLFDPSSPNYLPVVPYWETLQ